MRYPVGAKPPTTEETAAMLAELAADARIKYPQAADKSDAEAVALFLFNSLKDA